MGRPEAKKKFQGCVYDGCEHPLYSNGCCLNHYQWEYYHRVRSHGAAYFKQRAAVLDELKSRCEQYAPEVKKAKRKLRVVR